VGGALAAHEVAPTNERERAAFPNIHPREYPFDNVGALWCWSDNYGITWRIDNTILVGDKMQACAPPLELTDGTLMIPAYCSIGRSKVSSAMLYRSTDGGRSWSDMIVMARGRPQTRGYCEPVLMELAPGHLLCMLRVAGAGKYPPDLLWQNESFDNGNTWSAPKPTAIRSGACPRLLKLKDGRLLLTYGRPFEPYGIYASFSADGGPHGARTAGCCAKRPMLTRVIRHLSSWTMGASSLHVMQKMLAVLRALPGHSGIRPSKWMSFLSRKYWRDGDEKT